MDIRISGKILANEPQSEDVPPHDLNELGLLLFGEWFFVLIINDTFGGFCFKLFIAEWSYYEVV